MSRRVHVLTTAPCTTPPHRYFQLQAPGPGLWSLSLASGAELLSARHGAATGARHGAAVPGSRYAAPSARALPVPLLSYTGATLDILVGADPNHGLSTRTTAAPALAAAPASAAAGTALDETVHIFSLASGLLYERFLRIMMKTAVERASRPLKFWILGNFLSPAFRHAVNSGALATAVGAQVIASLIRWRSCSTIGRLSASECV
jgi:UDP-glucose:glycoprotein glucosyltransferase